MDKVHIVTGGQNTDADVLACAVAYTELLKREGKKTYAVITENFTMSVTPEILSWKPSFFTSYDFKGDEVFIMVDISDPQYFSDFVDHDRIGEIYDHRPGHQNLWKEKISNNSHIEMVGACGTLIWEAFKDRGHADKITQTSARLLLASIVSNTLNFKNAVTTERDISAYTELLPFTDLSDAWREKYFKDQDSLLLQNFAHYLEVDTKSKGEEIVMGQIELWDGRPVLKNHLTEMQQLLNKNPGKPRFITIPSISENKNYFYTNDLSTKKLLEEKMKVKFDGDIAETKELLLRKQIRPLLLGY